MKKKNPETIEKAGFIAKKSPKGPSGVEIMAVKKADLGRERKTRSDKNDSDAK